MPEGGAPPSKASASQVLVRFQADARSLVTDEVQRENIRSVTAQGSALTRFRRAVERKSLFNAELAAREMGRLDLEDALSLVLLYARADDPRFDRAATRWI